MDQNQRRAVRQRLTRQAKVEKASKTPFANQYGMTPAQIHKALKQTNTGKSDKPCKIERRKARRQSERPQKAVRKPNRRNPSLLLDVPHVTAQLAAIYPTPKWFTSTKKADVSVIIPMYKSATVIEDLIRSWDLKENMVVETIFVDDDCPHGSKEKAINFWSKRKEELQHPVGKIYYSPQNQGFGPSCNIGAQHATGDYLIFLNADVTVTPQWIRPIVRMLKKPDVGIVGNLHLKNRGVWKDTVDSAGSQWDWDDKVFHHIGKAIYRHKKIRNPFSIDHCPKDIFEVQEREMVTGACLAIRKDLFDEVGGFNPNYRIGYWEDSDLCLTVREKGYKVMYQPSSKIYHLGGHSRSGGHKYHQHNVDYFMNKWVNSHRIDDLVDAPRKEPAPEVGNILLKRHSAHGDVLVAAAVAPALKKKYPHCKVMFNTVCPEIVEDNPWIDKVLQPHEVSERTFQVLCNLDMVYEYRPKANLLEAYADAVGVKVEDCKLHLPKEPMDGLPVDYIVIHAGNTRWAGRDWSSLKFEVLASKLTQLGHNVVCVGTPIDHKVSCHLDLRGKTTIPQLSYVIDNAKLFIGIDSFPMHVAQTFNTPGLCFFGCVDPKTRLVGDCITPLTSENLECLGCHHRQPAPCTVTSHCETRMLDCINQVSINDALTKVEELCEK